MSHGRRGHTHMRALPDGAVDAIRAIGGYTAALTRHTVLVYMSDDLAPLLHARIGRPLDDPEFELLIHEACRADVPVTRVLRTDRLEPLRDVVARAAVFQRHWVLVSLVDRTAEVEAIRARRDVVANLGHELRTPVTSIGLIAQALQACPDDPATVTHFADRLARLAQRLDTLAGSMMTLADVQDGPSAAMTRLDVRTAVEQATAATQEAAQSAGIRLAVKCKHAVEVIGDVDMLATAVENLIANALQYSGPDTTVRVSLHVDQADRTVAVNVSDQGIGIAADEQQRIFERFYRADQARAHRLGGAGLGLAIVKNIALAHGGSVSVDSRPGAGSTFRLVLPLAPDAGEGRP